MVRPRATYPSAVDPGYDLTVRTAVRTLLKDGAPAAALVDPDRVMALVDGTSTKPAWQQRMALAYLVQIDYWLCTYRVRVLAAG